MPKIIPPGFIDVSYHFRLSGDPEAMVSNMAYALGDPTEDPQAFLAFLETKFTTAWGAGGRLSIYTLEKLVGYVGQDGGPPAVFEETVGSTGTSSSQPPPSNCAVLFKKNTNLGGRRGRGRMYLPPWMLAEGSVDANGNLDSGLISGFTSNANGAWVTELDPVLLHDSDGVTPAPAPTPIVNLTCQSKIATQRRRMRR